MHRISKNNIKTVITISFHIKKVKESLSMLSGDDWTSRDENIVSEVKHALDGVDTRLDTVEIKRQIWRPSNRNYQKQNREEKDLKNEQRISINRPNICVIVVPKRGEGWKKICLKNYGWKISILTTINSEIPESQMNHKLRNVKKFHQGTL